MIIFLNVLLKALVTSGENVKIVSRNYSIWIYSVYTKSLDKIKLL